MKSWMLLPILGLACVAAQADVYRWVDADGKIHFSDQPPPANIKQVEQKKEAGGKPGSPQLPYALQQAVKNFPVTLYSSACGDTCAKARDLLAKRGIPYTDMDATDPAAQVELKKITGGDIEVPVLQVGHSAIRGFQEGQWNNSLDAAGYPASAVIPPRPPTKPPKPSTKPAAAPASPSPEASQ